VAIYKTIARFSATLVIALSFGASTASANTVPLSAEHPAVGSGTVYRVLDGDTFIVNLDDANTYQRLAILAADDPDKSRYMNDRHHSIRVRLANVDTAESVHRDESRNTQEGANISTLVTDLIQGKPSYVQCYDWGDHGRPICTLELGRQGEQGDLGHWLIKEGHSDYVTFWGENPFYPSAYRDAAR
jgi:endonuclease YncB( thermonuclease family)